MTENKNQIYYLSFVVKTSEEHPHYAQVDQAYVGCWVQTDTDEKAIAVARELIEEAEVVDLVFIFGHDQKSQTANAIARNLVHVFANVS